MPLPPDMKRHWLSRLRRLEYATRLLANPALLNLKINRFLAREGWLEQIIAKRFSSEGASSGSAWPKLVPATIKQRLRQGFAAGPILTRSGTLQDAALKGRTTATATAITKEFKDRAAPRYLGGARSRKQKTSKSALAARDFFGFSVGSSGRVSDYAAALNRTRPFFGPPSREELKPMLKRRAEKLAELVRVISAGGKVSHVL